MCLTYGKDVGDLFETTVFVVCAPLGLDKIVSKNHPGCVVTRLLYGGGSQQYGSDTACSSPEIDWGM